VAADARGYQRLVSVGAWHSRVQRGRQGAEPSHGPSGVLAQGSRWALVVPEDYGSVAAQPVKGGWIEPAAGNRDHEVASELLPVGPHEDSALEACLPDLPPPPTYRMGPASSLPSVAIGLSTL
jgi:hypothetical protein